MIFNWSDSHLIERETVKKEIANWLNRNLDTWQVVDQNGYPLLVFRTKKEALMFKMAWG